MPISTTVSSSNKKTINNKMREIINGIESVAGKR